MKIGAIAERVREVSSVSDDAPAAGRSAIESAITASAEIKAWLAAADARLAKALASEVSFPEQTIAECTRESLRDATKAKERADTLGRVPGFADALNEAAVTAGHVDAITSKAKPLTPEQRAEYFDRVAGLVDVASAATVEEFRRRLALPTTTPRSTTPDGTSRSGRTENSPSGSPTAPSAPPAHPPAEQLDGGSMLLTRNESGTPP